MTPEVPLEIRQSILSNMIAKSKAAEFEIAASAKAYTTCEMTQQAEVQAKNLVAQQKMTNALEKQLEELTQ